jgi:putative transposase
MGQSLVQNYLHIVFSTKNRVHTIKPPYEEALHSYLGGICNELECSPLKIGGYTNHIHILCMLSKNIALSKLLQDLKANSSKWMKSQDDSLKNFYWQDGYGAFSVNPKDIEIVKKYINNQHQHHNHQTQSFEEEYLNLLKINNTPYDEKYIWL